MSVIKKIQLPDGTQLDVGVDDTTLVHKTGNETIAGTKTFSSTISGNISGSSASCTGNAATATKATSDGNGNNIVNTYATKSNLNNKQDTLTSGDSVSLANNIVDIKTDVLGYTTGEITTDERLYNEVLERKRSTFDRSKFDVEGSPTITDDGIASGFSRSNYLGINNINFSTVNSWEIKFKYTSNEGSTPDWSSLFGSINNDGSHNNSIVLFNTGSGTYIYWKLSSDGTDGSLCAKQSPALIKNKSYYITTKFTGIKYIFNIIDENSTSIYNEEIISSTKVCPFASLRIGYNATNKSIDLKQFSIIVDGVEVFNGNKTGIDQIKKDDYIKVGSPVISDDGIASGFISGNYLKKYLTITNENTLKLEVEFDYNSLDVYQRILYFNSSQLRIMCNEGGTVGAHINSGTNIRAVNKSTLGNPQDGSLIKVILELTSTTADFWVYVDGILKYHPEKKTGQSYDIASTLMQIGAYGSEYFRSSIDLNSLKVYVDDQLVYQPTLRIPYTQSKTGSKIVDANYRDRVLDMYNQFGSAPYYTLDDGNVSLPMGDVYGMIEGKHLYHEPLLSCRWSDHLLNDVSWLRADTFSWQSGDVYKTVYDKLVAEYNNSTSTTVTKDGITYKISPNGFKIAAADQETAILTKYNSTGIAWYYIIDTTNKRFKLPRTKFGFEGLRTNVGGKVGDDIAESLPNIKGSFSNGSYPLTPGANWSVDGCIEVLERKTASQSITVGSASQDTPRSLGVNASLSSSTYQDNAPVQERATQMYLYFYVGEYAQSAVEQTAGLNNDLFNAKADLTAVTLKQYCTQNGDTVEAPYLKIAYVNGTSGYNIWSNGYCEQWGRTNVKTDTTYIKYFKDTNYSLTLTWLAKASFNNPPCATTLTTSSFNLISGSSISSGEYCLWIACGYLAEGQY